MSAQKTLPIKIKSPIEFNLQNKHLSYNTA